MCDFDNSSEDYATDSRSIKLGKWLARPLPGEEVVITGFSGAFPKSSNMYEFGANLYAKRDLMDSVSLRWDYEDESIPPRIGTLNEIDKFDAGFFGIHHRQVTTMDPALRMVLEKVAEAIFDAGLRPSDLAGSRTCVFVCFCGAETESSWWWNAEPENFGMTGYARMICANRISYWLKLDGISMNVDTACSSSLVAMDEAYRGIRSGKYDAAIVASGQLITHPYPTMKFHKLGVLSKTGVARCFDEEANGYVRAEAVAATVIQKAKDARRIYAQVVHSKTNCDGYKEQGITYPSNLAQISLLKEFYEECGIDPGSLAYLEAHGTGTVVGDLEELKTIDTIFCKNRKTPLLVGTVKANMGHSEASSGLASLAKVIINLETGYISPNIRFETPRRGIPAFEENRIQIVTEKTKLQDDIPLIGISNFGFGGSNGHLLLRGYHRKKQSVLPMDDVPRLVCVSGRTEEAVAVLLDDVASRRLDAEYVALLQRVFAEGDIEGHRYRGYEVVKKDTGVTRREVKLMEDGSKEGVVVFGGYDERWFRYGKELFRVPLFAGFIQRVHDLLTPQGINITEEIVNGNNNSFLACLTIQLGICDIFKTIKLKPAKVIGLKTGELVSGYFHDTLSLQEIYSVAIKYEQEVHNQNTIPEEIISKKTEKSSVIMENCLRNGYGNHDESIGKSTSTPQRLKKLVEEKLDVLTDKVFGSCLENNGTKNIAKIITNESAILFVGFDNFIQLYSDITQIVFSKGNTSAVEDFLEKLGSFYLTGQNFSLENLYPPIQYPVTSGTPMISPLILWNHTRKAYVKTFDLYEGVRITDYNKTINLKDVSWSFLTGHIIDGRNLFPATGYLYVVWETASVAAGINQFSGKVVFKDIKFIRATTVTTDVPVTFSVSMSKGSNVFELFENEQVIVTGKIFISKDSQTSSSLLLPTSTINKKEVNLNENDVYKELKLRGYNYKGAFRSIKECTPSGRIGMIEWSENWIAFMDNMLQLKILNKDTRNLYVPTLIQEIVINAPEHLAYVKTFEGETPLLPVEYFAEFDSVRCGAISINGLKASAISKRRPLGEPVLEKYVFVPNETDQLTIEQSSRVNMQIALENNWTEKIKIYEIIDDFTRADEPLSPTLLSVFGDQPLIQAEATILCESKAVKEVPDVEVQTRGFSEEMECYLVVGSGILQRPLLLEKTLNSAKGGFVLSREIPNLQLPNSLPVEILTVHRMHTETLVFLQKANDSKSPETLEIPDSLDDFQWIENLKGIYDDNKEIVLYSQGTQSNGIIGLVNCIRKEPFGKNTKCVYVQDENMPKFTIEKEFYKNQICKGMAINVFQSGKWGTYRHLLLEDPETIESEHCYVNAITPGDISSMKWFQGPIQTKELLQANEHLVHVYYAALNFKDVMMVSAKLHIDVICSDRTLQQIIQGMEFSGRDVEGRRVMGMVSAGAHANLCVVPSGFLFPVPDEWSLEDAATVPVIYMTVLYALMSRVRIQKGQSILIHAGSGGIGQAAINVCLHYGLTIYTTVGTKEKREFIKKTFPQIQDHQIGNSRDTTFEQHILKQTHGLGVDYILNSLSEEKLLASVRCLKAGGNFVEIGKFDMSVDNPLPMQVFHAGGSFHSVMLDLFLDRNAYEKKEVGKLLVEGIANGSVKPIVRTVYEADEIDLAMRYLASGKHVGKIVVKVKSEEVQKGIVKPEVTRMMGIPRYFCNPRKSYVILGGLGGFGLELADWLVLRGCRKLILTSRHGVKTGYQAFRIRIWESYGVEIIISTSDITKKGGCYDLIKTAQNLGEVDAIFNLAVILQDAILENQNEDSFKTSFGPKACATMHLDKLSRVYCPNLRDFVVFSSVSCGRGNAGQTNYGMANSVMERICEKRKKEGCPALAIEWGAVGDVGLVAEMQTKDEQLEIAGTLQQKISSCLSVLDRFLNQNEPIVSSIVVAEKQSGLAADNIIEAIANIIGIRDIKTVSPYSTMSELGMDSMMSVEVKQLMERECQIFLPPAEVRSLTFARLQELLEERDDKPEIALSSDGSTHNTTVEDSSSKVEMAKNLLLNAVGDSSYGNVTSVVLNSKNPKGPTVFFLPGIEGTASSFRSLAQDLEFRAVSLQYYGNTLQSSLQELTASLLPQILSELQPNDTFRLVGHSFGCLVSLELVKLLEPKGYKGKIVLIDGAPDMVKKSNRQLFNMETDASLETDVISAILSHHLPSREIQNRRENLLQASSTDERLQLTFNDAPKEALFKKDYLTQVMREVFARIKAADTYQCGNLEQSKSNFILCRPEFAVTKDVFEDYGLEGIFGRKVPVKFFNGDHFSILQNVELCKFLNGYFDG